MSSGEGRFFKSDGFSIVEILVSVAILGIIVLGTTSAIEIGMKGQAAVEQRYAVVNLQNQVYSLLENTGVCTANFGAGANQKNVNLFTGGSTVSLGSGLQDAGGAVRFGIFNAGTGLPTYENGTIRISGMRLQNFQYLSGLEGQMDLALSIVKNKESYGSDSYRPRIVKIKVNLAGPYDATLATANYVNSCVAFGGVADQIWSKNADNTIFYNGANVGIGTTTPGSALDIKGTTPVLRLGDTAHVESDNLFASYISGRDSNNLETWWVGDGSPTGMKVGLGSARPTYSVTLITSNTERVVVDPTGNVGIGVPNPGTQLDVAGGMRAGSYASAGGCGAGIAAGEGTMLYDYTNHELKICNGTSWVSAGAGASDAGQPCGVRNGVIMYGNIQMAAVVNILNSPPTHRFCCHMDQSQSTPGVSGYGASTLMCEQY